MSSKPRSAAERMAAYRERKASAGNVALYVIVPKIVVERLDSIGVDQGKTRAETLDDLTAKAARHQSPAEGR